MAKELIREYLINHKYLTLSTVSEDNTPLVHTIGYVSEGCITYFATNRATRKYRNILTNPCVSYAVVTVSEDEQRVTGIQVQGEATIVKEQQEKDRVLQQLIRKFPFVVRMSQPNIAFIRISPHWGEYFEYSPESIRKEKEVFSR